MNIEWMKDIININSSQPVLQQEYCIEIDDNQWVMATNGHVMYVVKQRNDFPLCSDAQSFRIADWLKIMPGTLSTTVADLRAWAGNDAFYYCRACNNSKIFCFRCKNTGYVNDRECYNCRAYEKDEEICDHCKNSGYVNGYECRRGRINGVLINRWLIAKAFHNVPDGNVQVVTTGPESFIGDSWRVIVMPLSDELSDIETVEFTAWENT